MAHPAPGHAVVEPFSWRVGRDLLPIGERTKCYTDKDPFPRPTSAHPIQINEQRQARLCPFLTRAASRMWKRPILHGRHLDHLVLEASQTSVVKSPVASQCVSSEHPSCHSAIQPLDAIDGERMVLWLRLGGYLAWDGTRHGDGTRGLGKSKSMYFTCDTGPR
jgi:hypothetical protein